MKRKPGLKNNGKNEKKSSLTEKIEGDFAAAWEEFRAYEPAYRLLRPADLAYLGRQAALYKKAVWKLQKRILPAVRALCPSCPSGTCCRLHAPDLQIYIARSVGGFNFIDFLLARHGCRFPEPDLENVRKNLCVFWDDGCRLDPASRSLLCLQYFCPVLRGSLDMDAVDGMVTQVRRIVDRFSLRRLLQGKKTPLDKTKRF